MSSQRIIPSVSTETDRLQVVVLGRPDSPGPVPTLAECYDAKSYESVANGVYPTDDSIEREMSALLNILERNGVQVLRPAPIADCNQVFARDIGFVVDDTFFVANLIPDRARELEALEMLLDQIDSRHIERLPERVHTEGGDVILYGDTLFVGCYLQSDYPSFKMARTNQYAVDFFKERFPRKQIIALELMKHDHDPRQGVLHLDCAFQPVGTGQALLYPEAFLHARDAHLIQEFFGSENCFRVLPEEAYRLHTNVVSLSPTKLISDRSFTRLNQHLEMAWNIEVETVPYQEICKMGGLLRCSTMPLVRQSH